MLTLPSGDERYTVYCDASQVGLGRVLMQNEKEIMKAHFLLLIEFAYNNGYHASIEMAP